MEQLDLERDKADETAESLHAWRRDTVRVAKGGDVGAARDILLNFVERVEKASGHSWTGPIPHEYAQYLADAFRRIIQGTDAGIALGIKTPAGGPDPGTTAHNNMELAAAYWLLVRHRIPREIANARVCGVTGAHRRRVQKAAADHSMFEDREQINDQHLIAIIEKRSTLLGLVQVV